MQIKTDQTKRGTERHRPASIDLLNDVCNMEPVRVDRRFDVINAFDADK